MSSDFLGTKVGFLVAVLVAILADSHETEEIHGYHFHTYFFHEDRKSSQEALAFREAIQDQIHNGFLSHCVVKAVNMGPFGPHYVGNFETCCNKTSIGPAVSFFMLQHGNLSVLFHPLTRYEKMDHTGREMFLGPRIPIKTEVLAEDLQDFVDTCSSLSQGPAVTTTPAPQNGGKGSPRKAAPKQPTS